MRSQGQTEGLLTVRTRFWCVEFLANALTSVHSSAAVSIEQAGEHYVEAAVTADGPITESSYLSSIVPIVSPGGCFLGATF